MNPYIITCHAVTDGVTNIEVLGAFASSLFIPQVVVQVVAAVECATCHEDVADRAADFFVLCANVLV